MNSVKIFACCVVFVLCQDTSCMDQSILESFIESQKIQRLGDKNFNDFIPQDKKYSIRKAFLDNTFEVAFNYENYFGESKSFNEIVNIVLGDKEILYLHYLNKILCTALLIKGKEVVVYSIYGPFFSC